MSQSTWSSIFTTERRLASMSHHRRSIASYPVRRKAFCGQSVQTVRLAGRRVGNCWRMPLLPGSPRSQSSPVLSSRLRNLVGLLDRLWSPIGEALFGDTPRVGRRHRGRAPARAGEGAGGVAARQDRSGQDRDRRRAHRRPARRGRTGIRALHADRGILRRAARGAAAPVSRYARARRGELRSRPTTSPGARSSRTWCWS